MIEGALGAGRARVSVPWRHLLANSQLWVLSAMYFCYAYCINIFLTWFPKYLHDARGFDIALMGLFASLPLMAGVVGDLMGGWASDLLIVLVGAIGTYAHAGWYAHGIFHDRPAAAAGPEIGRAHV